MSAVMAFSVYSLNISNTIPIQSLVVPKITEFYTASIFANLVAMSWFIQLNNIKSKAYLPCVLSSLGDILQKLKCFCFHWSKNCKKSNNVISKDNKVDDLNEEKINNTTSCRFCSTSANGKLELSKINDSKFQIINNFFSILFLIGSILIQIIIWCS